MSKASRLNKLCSKAYNKKLKDHSDSSKKDYTLRSYRKFMRHMEKESRIDRKTFLDFNSDVRNWYDARSYYE